MQQAGRHAVRRLRERSVADAEAGNSPSQLRASVFLSVFPFFQKRHVSLFRWTILKRRHPPIQRPLAKPVLRWHASTLSCKLNKTIMKMLGATLALNTSQLLIVLVSFARALAGRYQFQHQYYEHKPGNKTRTDTKQQKCETNFPGLESVVKLFQQSAVTQTHEKMTNG